MCDEFLAQDFAQNLMNTLLQEVEWEQPKIKMGGFIIQSPRLSAWYGDSGAVYTYSGVKNEPRTWIPNLLEWKTLLSNVLGLHFNSVLLNYYRNGNDSMGWHQDNEKELGKNPTIFSLSLGESRKFTMKHITESNERWQRILKHGSALVMLGETQHWWKHSIPKTKVNQNERVNLTFRQILTT